LAFLYLIRCCCTLNFIKHAFHFVLDYQTDNFHILIVPLNKALFFLAHLTQMWAIVTTERPSSVIRPLTFHILINSSETTGPIRTKLWWNGPWMAPFQNCVRWSWLPTKMAAKLKIEKRGDEILIVHCCFSISQNELKF
jgi:hypothetical protein